MKELTPLHVSKAELPIRWTGYREHVVEHGHQPGVLSGSELLGKARSYSQSYARSRKQVEAALAKFNIRSDLALVNHRWCRVWMLGNHPVRLILS